MEDRFADKSTVVRRLIHGAVRNTCRLECPITNHVVIHSANGILEEYAKRTGAGLQFDILARAKLEYKDEMRRLIRSRYTFFKHAKRDHDQEINITSLRQPI
jgi:hypothetical protein